MDCNQARRLLGQGDDAGPGDRDAALEHLDGCRECAALAPRLDPVLLFRRLPATVVDGDEISRMRQAVTVLRRVPAEPEPGPTGVTAMRLAAAVVAGAALLLAPGPPQADPGLSGAVEARLAGPVPAPEYLPSVEMLGSSGAYVATQVTEDDLTLVILANVDVTGR